MSYRDYDTRSQDAHSGTTSLLDSELEAAYSNSRAAKFENTGEIQYPFEDTTGSGDENKIRGNWTSKSDFFASCLGFSVGFTNFWRFPYFCYVHGGSAFLLPYLLMLFLIGIPIYFIEISIGQFASVGCITVWKVCPLFKGVGIAMFIIACLITVYYNVIIAWCIYYVIHSLRSQVPWASCDNIEWNTPNCTISSRSLYDQCLLKNGTLFPNGSCVTYDENGQYEGQAQLLDTYFVIPNQYSLKFSPHSVWPSSEYFHRKVLELPDDIAYLGKIHWQLALYLLSAWIVVFFCLFKGVKSSGKVVYVTTTLPYIFMFVFLVRALFLTGSVNGIVEFIKPDWTKLLNLRVWGDAAVQVFYSLCCCWGGLITLASYNRFHTNCYKQTWLICFGDVLSSIFFGVVVFATLGFMAHETDAPSIYSIVQKDYGIAFVVFSETIARLPVAPVWAVLFFSMLIFLGIDSQVIIIETIITAICDEFPENLRKFHRHVLALLVCIFYACGILFCTQAGLYYIQLMDNYVATWSLLVIAFFECMALVWVYGVDNLLDNIKWMIGYFPMPYIFWKMIWIAVTPSLIMAILIYTWIYYERTKYANYAFPEWANNAGWAISFLPVSAIPITALFKFCTTKGTCAQRFRILLSPEDDWGPALAVYRSQEYPLQIPEARDPVRLPWISKKRAKLERQQKRRQTGKSTVGSGRIRGGGAQSGFKRFKGGDESESEDASSSTKKLPNLHIISSSNNNVVQEYDSNGRMKVTESGLPKFERETAI